jgi:hypothetical protein
MPVTKYQIKSVIAAYIKNVKTRIGAYKPSTALSEETGVKTPRKMIEDMMYDRVGEHVLEKLKKSKTEILSIDDLREN